MTEKEKRVQSALGTIKRQMFVSADWKDTEGLLDGFEAALKNFGLFMYCDPGYKGSDTYGYVISNEALTDEQLKKLCEYDEEEEEEE